jgi:hypothetical protein
MAGTSFVEGARTVSLESCSIACSFAYFEVDGLGCVVARPVDVVWDESASRLVGLSS